MAPEIVLAWTNLVVATILTGGLLWTAIRQTQLGKHLNDLQHEQIQLAKPRLQGDLVAHAAGRVSSLPSNPDMTGWGVLIYNRGQAPVDILSLRLLRVTADGQISASEPRYQYLYTSGLDVVIPMELPLRVEALGSRTLWLEGPTHNERNTGVWLRIHRPGDADFIRLEAGGVDIEKLEHRFASIDIMAQAPYGSNLGPKPSPRVIRGRDPLAPPR